MAKIKNEILAEYQRRVKAVVASGGIIRFHTKKPDQTRQCCANKKNRLPNKENLFALKKKKRSRRKGVFAY